MDIFLIFNELSAQDGVNHPTATEYDAIQWMSDLAETVITASKEGIALRVYRDFINTEIIAGYTVDNWLAHLSKMDRDMRRKINSSITALGFLDDEPLSEKDFYYHDRSAKGLGNACLLDSIAISLRTQSQWEETSLPIRVVEMDDEGSIFERVENINHVSLSIHLVQHQAWYQDRRTTSVTNGQDLLSKWGQWFPKLKLIQPAQSQIAEMNAGTPQLRQVVARLFEFQNYCETWESGGFDKSLLKNIAPESQSTAMNPALRAERTFKLPNGEEGYFEWHVRLTPNHWRLHFLPDAKERMIYIGYVGKHLTLK